jgi:CubicO group peptidase (beta-lactamase class C family)
VRECVSGILIDSFLLLFSACSYFSPEVESVPDVDAELNRIIATNGIPSVAAAIVKGDTIIWQRYYGFADYENRTAAQSETIYELASVSKLVVVTAVMQLKERGLINLNADINTYLPFKVRNPHCPEYAITCLHLLTHTSGLAWPTDEDGIPGFYDYYPLDSAPPLSQWLPRYILTSGDHYRATVWKNSTPGTREQYSNIGAALLAYIVEAVIGSDFATYCKRNIFEPLDMNNTSYAYSDLDMNKVAKIYGDNYAAIGYYRQLHFPAHSLKSTVKDFAHFMAAYMNGGQHNSSRILSETTINEILTMHNPASGTCLLWDCDLGNWFGHSGGEPGVAARAEFQRDARIGIVIFSNKRNKLVYPGMKIHAVIRGEAGKYLRK